MYTLTTLRKARSNNSFQISIHPLTLLCTEDLQEGHEVRYCEGQEP